MCRTYVLPTHAGLDQALFLRQLSPARRRKRARVPLAHSVARTPHTCAAACMPPAVTFQVRWPPHAQFYCNRNRRSRRAGAALDYSKSYHSPEQTVHGHGRACARTFSSAHVCPPAPPRSFGHVVHGASHGAENTLLIAAAPASTTPTFGAFVAAPAAKAERRRRRRRLRKRSQIRSTLHVHGCTSYVDAPGPRAAVRACMMLKLRRR